jgi:hypothetical protein
MEREISVNRLAISVSAYAIERKSLLSLEYAKCKNRPTDFTLVTPSFCGSQEFVREQRIKIGASHGRSLRDERRSFIACSGNTCCETQAA